MNVWVNLGELFKNKKMILYAGQQWRLRHREQTCGNGGRERVREQYWNTDITVWKTAASGRR